MSWITIALIGLAIVVVILCVYLYLVVRILGEVADAVGITEDRSGIKK